MSNMGINLHSNKKNFVIRGKTAFLLRSDFSIRFYWQMSKKCITNRLLLPCPSAPSCVIYFLPLFLIPPLANGPFLAALAAASFSAFSCSLEEIFTLVETVRGKSTLLATSVMPTKSVETRILLLLLELEVILVKLLRLLLRCLERLLLASFAAGHLKAG